MKISWKKSPQTAKEVHPETKIAYFGVKRALQHYENNLIWFKLYCLCKLSKLWHFFFIYIILNQINLNIKRKEKNFKAKKILFIYLVTLYNMVLFINIS